MCIICFYCPSSHPSNALNSLIFNPVVNSRALSLSRDQLTRTLTRTFGKRFDLLTSFSPKATFIRLKYVFFIIFSKWKGCSSEKKNFSNSLVGTVLFEFSERWSFVAEMLAMSDV